MTKLKRAIENSTKGVMMGFILLILGSICASLALLPILLSLAVFKYLAS